MREEEPTSHPNLRPDTHWRGEDEDAQGKWTYYTQGAQGLSPHSQSGLAPEPLLPTGTDIWISDLHPKTPPHGFPDVLGAGLAFLLECFLLTYLSLPRSRKGREA